MQKKKLKGVVRTAVCGLDVMRLLLDLGFQVLFVRQDVSVPLGDGLILAHPDLLSDLAKEDKNKLVTVLRATPAFSKVFLKMFANGLQNVLVELA